MAVSDRRNLTLLGMVESMMNLKNSALSLGDYALESANTHSHMVPTKKVDKESFRIMVWKCSTNLSFLKVWGCEALVKRDTPDKLQQRSINGMAMDLEEIQDEDTSPSKITSEIPMEVEEAKEHSLWDLNEPTSYKAVMLDFEYNKLIDAMNAEIQSMMDNMNVSQTSLTFESFDSHIYSGVHMIMYNGKADTSKLPFLNGYLDDRLLDGTNLSGFVDPNHPRKYLRNTKRYVLGLWWKSEAKLRVDCYCDAGFETDRDDTKSQTGYVFILNGGAVDWKSSKQSTTVMSATEAEYIATMEAI
ncbi:zinc finger, CCHC-type containing protein [Tanacetum coccineum]